MSVTRKSLYGNVSYVVQPLEPAWVPNAFVRNVGLVGGVAFLTAVAARFSVPWEPVPFTLQTIPVLLSGLWLGARRGYLAQVIYLAAGAIGLPVFGGGASGAAHIAGPTGGYLVAFPICALALGALTDRGWVSGTVRLTVTLLLGNLIILGVGWAWLSLSLGASLAFSMGVVPFLVVSLAKSVMCLAVLPEMWRGFRRPALAD
ncbi:biotin transporter BioY [soil metagenome]